MKVSDKSRYIAVLLILVFSSIFIFYNEIAHNSIKNTIHFKFVGYLIYPILLLSAIYSIYICIKAIFIDRDIEN